MRFTPETVFDRLLPSADELWDRGGAQYKTRIIDDRSVDIPYFPIDVTVDETPLSEGIFRSKRGRLLGRSVVHQVRVNDGQFRQVRLNQIDDSVRNDELDFFVRRGAAWFTGMEGYGRDRIDATAALLGIDTIQISAVGDGARFEDAKQVLSASTTHSLAKSAQTKQHIISQLHDRYSLAPQQVATGCSMDNMETFAEIAYAQDGPTPIIWHDGVAPCGLDDLSINDLPKVAKWIGYEFSDIPALAIDAARHGRLKTLTQTLSAEPAFLIHSLIGNTPALASDETRRMLEWLPTDTAGHQTIYLRDGMSGSPWIEALLKFKNIQTKEVKRRHLDLVRERARDCQLARLAFFANNFSELHRSSLTAAS